MSIWWTIGALNACLSVGLGAFGSHGLKKITNDPQKIEYWKTASNYQMFHSIGTMLAPFSGNPFIVGSLFTCGTILFSGSLYTLVLTDKKKLGAITPIGGLSFMGGWLSLAYTGLKFVKI